MDTMPKRTPERAGDEVGSERPLPFTPRSRQDELAAEVAAAFKDQRRLVLYRSLCNAYDEQSIRRALATVQAVPEERIRKSRPALFVYLLKHYASVNKN